MHCCQDVGCNVCCCSVHYGRLLLPPNVSGWGRCLMSGLSTGLASRSYWGWCSLIGHVVCTSKLLDSSTPASCMQLVLMLPGSHAACR